MTLQILTKDLSTLGITESSCHLFEAEASTLGLTPTEWPLQIPTDMGNGRDFILAHQEIREGELLWVTFRQVYGIITLRIFND